jgi:NhaP-type Na+/H+ or K+/H+ antiporter
VYLGWRAPELITPQTRLQATAIWEILVFLLNATLFILIGLQLPVIVDGLDAYTTGEVIGYAALVCATVIATRFAFNFTMPYVIRALDRRRRSGSGGRARACGSSRPGRGCAERSPWRRPWRSPSRPMPARRFSSAT